MSKKKDFTVVTLVIAAMAAFYVGLSLSIIGKISSLQTLVIIIGGLVLTIVVKMIDLKWS